MSFSLESGNYNTIEMRIEISRESGFKTLLRFHIDGVSDITPMNLLQYGCQCQIMTETSFGQRKCLSENFHLTWSVHEILLQFQNITFISFL